jgi:folate-binding protein YgfZ
MTDHLTHHPSFTSLTPNDWRAFINTTLILEGRDAKDFLQRLTTTHLKFLKPQQTVPSFFLNSQGKILSFFLLTCLSETQYQIEMESGQADQNLQQLQKTIDQFTFNEQQTLTLVKTESLNVEPHQEHERILNLIPRVSHEIIFDINPLDLGLTSAIAQNKGCYPGQEVIEKIISLGSAAKKLCLVEVIQEPSQPSQIVLGACSEGMVTSVSPTQPHLALAVLRKTHAEVDKTLQQNALTLIVRKVRT